MIGELVGAFFDGGARTGPAVVLLGGSEGGWPVNGAAIARRLGEVGHPALALGYFGLPGLPERLESVPLEYFADALDAS